MNIHFGIQHKGDPLKTSSNKVRTQKYTAYTWAPLSLFNQFRRVSNVYFLLISILTFLPFSPKDPTSMIGTFLFVLTFTMLKEAYEVLFECLNLFYRIIEDINKTKRSTIKLHQF